MSTSSTEGVKHTGPCSRSELNADGEGLCSVPLWMAGAPCGHCDNPAFGFRPEAPVHRRWDGFEWRDDMRYTGYVPGLACEIHGGPSTRVFKDGSAWCAVHPGFTNLQESDAGFGATPEEARANLAAIAKAQGRAA